MAVSETPTGIRTFESYKPQTESQERVKNILRKLAEVITNGTWNYTEPAIIGLQGNPGVGKTHLINAFLNELSKEEVPYLSNKNDPYFLMQYKMHIGNNPGVKVVVIDDLFQDVSDLEELKDENRRLSNGHIVKLNRIKDMIYDIYENNRILIVSSNLNILEILQIIANEDKVGRIKSRIEELISHTKQLFPDSDGILKVEGPDYREIKAKTGSTLAELLKK